MQSTNESKDRLAVPHPVRFRSASPADPLKPVVASRKPPESPSSQGSEDQAMERQALFLSEPLVFACAQRCSSPANMPAILSFINNQDNRHNMYWIATKN